jgi:hypothetical protein
MQSKQQLQLRRERQLRYLLCSIYLSSSKTEALCVRPAESFAVRTSMTPAACCLAYAVKFCSVIFVDLPAAVVHCYAKLCNPFELASRFDMRKYWALEVLVLALPTTYG